MTRYTLELPLPPSPNELRSTDYHDRGWGSSKRRKVKRNAFFRACEQRVPTTSPPERVRVTAHFRVYNLRDPDNLVASMKLVLDALRLPREGEDVSWRHGIAAPKGYFVDDSEAHLELGKVTQEIDRGNEGVTLTIEALESESEAA